MMFKGQANYDLMFQQIVNRLLWLLSIYRLFIVMRRYGSLYREWTRPQGSNPPTEKKSPFCDAPLRRK